MSQLDVKPSPQTAVGPRFHARNPAPPPPRNFLRTATGRAFRFDLADPGQVHWRDVAAQLAKINRFAGATSHPYSVAQHSVLVCDIIATRSPKHDLAPLYGLLDDVPEMTTGDVPAPMIARQEERMMAAVDKWLSPDAVVPEMIAGLKAELQASASIAGLQAITARSVILAAGLPWPVPPDIEHIVRAADLVARHHEARFLLADPVKGVPPWPELENLRAWHQPIRCLTWDKAEELFLDRLRVCAVRAGKPLDI